MSLTIYAEGVDNPANLARIQDAACLLGVSCSPLINGELIAVENASGAHPVYGRRPLRRQATLAVGNERRGLSRTTLAGADETVVIPTLSRTVTTLNVAAAAAVAGWYVLRGSGAQAGAARPERRRPVLLLVGDDHVEVGSSLRSAAAFGYRDVLLEDRGAGWFDGPAPVRREAHAAARRHKNPLRVQRATVDSAAGFDEIVVVTPSGHGASLQRQRLAHGRRQLIVVGVQPDEIATPASNRVRVASLELEPIERAPLRLVASIVLAEIARQVGRRRPMPGPTPGPTPGPRAPRYEQALELAPAGDVLIVEPSQLLEY